MYLKGSPSGVSFTYASVLWMIIHIVPISLNLFDSQPFAPASETPWLSPEVISLQ